LEDRGIGSLLLNPLVINGHFSGCLIMGSPRQDYFSKDTLRLVQRVADQICGALIRMKQLFG
jgi:GAF domain-containing protein